MHAHNMDADKARHGWTRLAFRLMGGLTLWALLAGCPDSEAPRKPPPGPRTPDAPRVPEPKVRSKLTPAPQAQAAIPQGKTALTVVPQPGADCTLNCPP